MRIFIVITLLITQSIGQCNCTCGEEGVRANQNDESCQTYIFCLRLSDGVFIEKLYRCPNGTLFDPLKKACAKNFDCITPTTISSIVTDEPSIDFECSAQGRFPDENDITCTHYFFCYYLPSGRYLMKNYTCPSGTKFNPKLQTCSARYQCNLFPATTTTVSSTSIAPKDFNCTKQGRFPVEKDETCRSYRECFYLTDGSFIEQVYICPSVLKFDPATQTCNADYPCTIPTTPLTTQSDVFVCPSAGRFPDDADKSCKSYFYCLKLPNGALGSQIFSCPGGEQFDPQRQTCSSAYKCESSLPSVTTLPSTITTKNVNCIKQGLFPVQEDGACRSFYNCTSSADNQYSQEILTCPDNRKFDPKLQSCTPDYQCIKSSSTSTTQSNNFLCPSTGRFPDDTDKTCGAYFYCVELPNGEMKYQIFECREGEKFDPKLLACSGHYNCSMQFTTKLLTDIKETTTFSILTVPPIEKTPRTNLNTDSNNNTLDHLSTGAHTVVTKIKSKGVFGITEVTNSSTYITTVNGNIICESVGNFPDSSDETCKSYFFCHIRLDGYLQATKKKCELHELFDPYLKECSSSYICKGESGRTTTGIPIEEYTSTTTQQNNNDQFSTSDYTTDMDTHDRNTDNCVIIDDTTFASGKHFHISSSSNNLRTSISIEDVSRSTQKPTSDEATYQLDDVCKSSGRFAILRDRTCKTYYLCVVGPNGNFISSRYSCASTEFFDPSLRKCSTTYMCDHDST